MALVRENERLRAEDERLRVQSLTDKEWIRGIHEQLALEKSQNCAQHEWFSGGCPCDCHTK